MAKVPLITALRPNTLLPTGDRYIPIGCTADGSETTEANIEYRNKVAGTYSGLWAYVDTVSSPNIALKFRKNNADGNQNVSLNSTGAKEDTSNSDSAAVNDDLNLMYDRTSGQAGVSIIRTLFEATSGDLYLPCISNSPGGLGVGVIDRYPCVMGEISGVISEGPFSVREIFQNATWSNLATYVPTNSKSVTTNFRSRINGSNGNQVVAVGASSTGFFEDTSHIDDLTAGDNINYVVNIGGTGVITLSTITSLILFDTTDGFSMWSDSRTNSQRSASTTTHYLPLVGGFNSFISNTNEASAQVQFGVKGVISNLTIYTSTSNNYTSDATVRLRINGANGNQVITIPALDGTGKFEDTSHVDSIEATDLVCLSVVGGGSSTLTFRGTGFKFEYAPESSTVDVTKSLAYTVLTQTDVTKGLAYEIARPIEELVDNFNDNTLDTGLWEEYNDPTVGDVYEEEGVQNFSLGDATEGRFGIRSIKRYTLEGSVISVQGVLAGSTDNNLNQYPLYLEKDENNALFFKQNGKTLYAVKRVAGVETTIASETNDIVHYLRIRESGGTIYFERTDDYFGSWTEIGTESTPIDITNLRVDLSLEGIDGGPTNPEIMKLDNVNTGEQTVDVTKELGYSVKATNDTTKNLSYAIKNINTITKGLAYAVKSTSDITKNLAYVVKTTSAITKGLAYEVVNSTDITKNLSYAVRSQVDITKNLAYLVESSQEVTKDLAYKVLSNTDINKTLAYKIRSQTDITKGMAYEIANATQITKGLSYAVLTKNEITKGLGYAIKTEAQITKDLAYKVKTTNEVTKGLAYAVETPASSVDITKSLSYAIRSNTDITKTLAYLVKTESQVQLGLAYEITLNVCPYPGIAIAPYTEADSPYSAASEIYTPRC